MPTSVSSSSIHRLSGILFLFLWSIFTPSFAVPAPIPTMDVPSQSSFFDAERSASISPFEDADPCDRSRDTTWVPSPSWQPKAVLDFQEVFRKAAAERRLTMLIVYSEGCSGWTRTVAPLLKSKEVLTIARDEFDTYIVNADDAEQVFLIEGREFSAPQLADMLEIEQFPTFVLFEANGKLIQLLSYPDSPRELQATLENAVEFGSRSTQMDQTRAYAAPDADLDTRPEVNYQLSPNQVLHLEDKRDPRPLAVFFERSKCHECDHFWEHILSDSRTRSLLSRFRVARFEQSYSVVLAGSPGRQLTVAAWSRELGITRTPAVVIFDSSGRRIRYTGDNTDLFRFQSLLDYVISGAYESDPSFPHFLCHRGHRLRSHDNAVNSQIY
jgi:thioredoxin-related protein